MRMHPNSIYPWHQLTTEAGTFTLSRSISWQEELNIVILLQAIYKLLAFLEAIVTGMQHLICWTIKRLCLLQALCSAPGLPTAFKHTT